MFFLIKQYFTLLFLWKRDFTVYVDVSRACWTSSTIIRSSLYWKHSFSDLLQKLVPCRQAACFNHTDRLHHWTTPCGFKRNKQDTALKQSQSSLFRNNITERQYTRHDQGSRFHTKCVSSQRGKCSVTHTAWQLRCSQHTNADFTHGMNITS